MATLFTDDFNRANSATVDATNWEEAEASWEIVGNRARLITGGAAGALLTKVAAHAGLTDCQVTCTQHLATGDGGPAVRWFTGTTGASSHGYFLDVYGGRIEVYRHDSSGSGTLVGSGVGITSVADAIISLKVEGTGATVTLTTYHNGVQKEVINDVDANRITTAQRTGIVAFSGGVDGDYDDFLAESLAAERRWILGGH